MSKRTLEEMMASEKSEEFALRTQAAESLRCLLPVDCHAERDACVLAMVATLEEYRLACAKTGRTCHATLFASPHAIRYHPRQWPAVVVKFLCQVHTHNYASVMLRGGGGVGGGKTVEQMDAAYYEGFRRHLAEAWNKAHADNLAHWETRQDGSIALIIK